MKVKVEESWRDLKMLPLAFKMEEEATQQGGQEPLEAGSGKAMDSLLEPSEGAQSC